MPKISWLTRNFVKTSQFSGCGYLFILSRELSGWMEGFVFWGVWQFICLKSPSVTSSHTYLSRVCLRTVVNDSAMPCSIDFCKALIWALVMSSSFWRESIMTFFRLCHCRVSKTWKLRSLSRYRMHLYINRFSLLLLVGEFYPLLPPREGLDRRFFISMALGHVEPLLPCSTT